MVEKSDLALQSLHWIPVFLPSLFLSPYFRIFYLSSLSLSPSGSLSLLDDFLLTLFLSQALRASVTYSSYKSRRSRKRVPA